MILVIKKLYKIKEECFVVLKCYLEFFNIYLYIVFLILGVILVLEEECVNGVFVDDVVI